MIALLRQVAAATKLAVASAPQRPGLTVATIVSIAFVVGVLLAFLAMAAGFHSTMASSGSDDIAIALREGSQAELNSVVSREQVVLLEQAPGVARDASGAPIVSSELYVVVDAIKRSTGTAVNLSLRGVGPLAAEVRGGIEIVEGRMFTPGSNELVVGQAVQREFTGFELDREIVFGTSRWVVVGIFAQNGSAFESEVWADLPVVQSLFNRGSSVQSVRARVEGAEGLEAYRTYVAEEPRLLLDVSSEREHYAAQSQQLDFLVNFVGWPIAVVMAFGALFGAINTMQSSVEARTREIATMRAIGFGSLPAFVATLLESLVLAGLGGLIGAGVVFLVFNGLSASTLGSGFTQVVFAFSVTPDVIVTGVVMALIIGFIGGVLPAFRAAFAPLLAVHQE